jgi:PAS domain S-box-containing protein
MTGIRFNILQRRTNTNKTVEPAADDTDQSSLSPHGAGGLDSTSAALVTCIPCPALIVDADRKISAFNEPFCDAFAIQTGYFHIGEDFADFARRMSLSGNVGLLAIGDFLTSDKAPRDTEIVARNGAIFEARACRTADESTLITLSEPTPSDNSELARYSSNVIKNMPGAALSIVRRADGFLQCLNANNQCLELFGIGLREITGATLDFRTVIAETHRQKFETALEQCSERTEPFDMEFQIRNEATGLRWVRCLGTGSRGTNGAVVVYLRMIDVENRRRVDAERKRLQQLLDMVIDNIPMMVNVKTAKDRTLALVNRAFEDMSGLSRSDILEKKVPKPFSDWDDIQVSDDQVVKTRQPVTLPETTVTTPHKGERILKSRKYPMLGQSGEIGYILTITEDVTEHRNAENALRHSDQRLRDTI